MSEDPAIPGYLNVPGAEPIETLPPEQDPDSPVTVEEMRLKADRLEASIAERIAVDRAAVLEQVVRTVRLYGITVDEVDAAVAEIENAQKLHRLSRARKRPPVKPKYRDPVSGALWAGRGREPFWISGRNRDEFLIPDDFPTPGE